MSSQIPYQKRTSNRIAWISILIGTIALLLALRTQPSGSNESTDTSYSETISEHNAIRVGYGGFPPFTVINPSDRFSPSGFSVDLVEEIASRMDPPVEVEWVLFSWESVLADLQSGTFDFIADPIYMTIPRSLNMDYSIPYAYFGIGAAIVKKEENRFSDFQDLNRSDIVIAVAEGWTTTEYAESKLPNAVDSFVRLSVDGAATTQFDEVRLGSADIALNDAPTVAQYARAFPEDVKALWLTSPPSRVAGAFATRRGESDLLRFLNEAINVMIADGTLSDMASRRDLFAEIPDIVTSPGGGLQ